MTFINMNLEIKMWGHNKISIIQWGSLYLYNVIKLSFLNHTMCVSAIFWLILIDDYQKSGVTHLFAYRSTRFCLHPKEQVKYYQKQWYLGFNSDHKNFCTAPRGCSLFIVLCVLFSLLVLPSLGLCLALVTPSV